MDILNHGVFKSLLAVASVFVVSCATITVNVYFPAEEVREAYSSLEEEFLDGTAEGATPPAKTPEPSPVPSPGPRSLKEYPDEPQLSERRVIVLKREISLDFGEYAWAQGNVAQQITEKIRGMPEVIQAYQRRSRRSGEINQMLSSGVVVEGSQGLLVQKGSLTPEQTRAFSSENADRKIIIRGMARAIVEINNIEPTPENVDKVLPEAARQFASVRQREGR